MTSPRQRKKRLRLKLAKEKQEVVVSSEVKEVVKPVEVVAQAAAPVLESPGTLKAKKLKNGLVETKSQDQVVEQPKEEVKTETKE